MKILMLHVASDLYGTSKIIYLVAKKLQREGHEVHLVVSEDGPLVELFKAMGAKTSIVRLGVLRKRYMNFMGLLNRIKVLTIAYFKLRSLIKEEQVNIIYSNTTPVIIGGFISKTMGIPNVWHIHEIMDPKGSLVHRIFSKIIKHSSTKVIVVSDAVYQNWLPYLGSKKLIRIYNGIPMLSANSLHTTIRDELYLGSDDILVGMVGRLNLHKGQFYFLEIAKELIRVNAFLKFIIVGDAFSGYEYLYDQLRDFIKSNGLEKHVFYLGYRTDIAEIISALDVFVLPSIHPDSFPTVVLEAMALGKPVVATKQGGALEQLVNIETGLFIPINDSVEAASIMQPLLSNEELRKTFGANGKKRLETHFSLDVFEQNILELFESIK